MSWIEDVKTKMIIQTGDGKQFIPSWVNAKASVSWQTAEFEFPEVRGTLVDKREQKGTKFNLEIFFQGVGHLDKMKEFVLSSQDKRYWTISHPLYEILTVQPISLDIDNSSYNVSKLTLVVIQTIVTSYPSASIIIEDRIEEGVDIINEMSAAKFANDVIPSSSDKKVMADVVDVVYFNGNKDIIQDVDGQEFTNKFNDANSKIDKATEYTNDAVTAMQEMLTVIAFFEQPVSERIAILKRIATGYRDAIIGEIISEIPQSYKSLYESIGSAVCCAMALAASKPFNDKDYANRVDVIATVDSINYIYNLFIEDLDTLQTGTGGGTNDYIPSGETILNLSDLVSFTMANLFNLALDAKQERTFLLEDDTDIINLSHRLYGLKEDDSTIDELIRNNALGLKSILNIEKGTRITYYI